MNDLLGLWFGFFGIVVGAVVTFLTEIIIRRGQMKFDMSIEVRKTLMDLNSKLLVLQTKVLHEYETKDETDLTISYKRFKDLHWDTMEAYKIYRIHLGDCKAYELNSSIFNYYHEYISQPFLNTIKLSKTEFDFGYYALKDSIGLMINYVRFELVKINSLKKITVKDKKYIISEYKRYSDRILTWLDNESNKHLIDSYMVESSVDTRLDRCLLELTHRISPFYDEYNNIVI